MHSFFDRVFSRRAHSSSSSSQLLQAFCSRCLQLFNKLSEKIAKLPNILRTEASSTIQSGTNIFLPNELWTAAAYEQISAVLKRTKGIKNTRVRQQHPIYTNFVPLDVMNRDQRSSVGICSRCPYCPIDCIDPKVFPIISLLPFSWVLKQIERIGQ